MEFLKILIELRSQGIALNVCDNVVQNYANKSDLSVNQRQWIINNTSKIIKFLAEQPSFFKHLPIASNQKALWFLYQLAPLSCAYNMHVSFLLGGNSPKNETIDLKLLKQSFYQMINHHSALRTGYDQNANDVYGLLYTEHAAEFTTEYCEYSDEQCKKWVSESSEVPFNLEAGYVCRANILVNSIGGKTKTYVALTLHHIAGDYYSIEQLMSTWAQYYIHLLKGEPCPKPSEQYHQWVAEQQEYLSSSAVEKATNFWIKALTPLPEPLSIPADFVRNDIQQFDGAELRFDADTELTYKIKALASEYKTTSYAIIFSAFQFYLYKLSGQSTFIVGSPTMGRYGSRHRSVVGYCVNPILIPADFSHPFSFKELVDEFSRFFRSTQRYQKMPLSLLNDSLATKRSADRTAIVSHMFTYTRVHEHSLAMPITDTVIDAGQKGAAHELNLVVYEYAEGFRFHWRFNSGLYYQTTVESMATIFFDLINTLLTAPDVQLDKHAFTQWLPYTSLKKPATKTAMSLWQNALPEKIALLYFDTKMTVSEVNEKAAQWAFLLAKVGVNKGDRVAILLPRGIEQIVAMLSVWYTGAAFVPLDLTQPRERSLVMLSEADVSACIGSGPRPDWLCSQLDWVDITRKTVDKLEPVIVTEFDLAYLIFTSGSTGKPKAVCIGHGALASYVTAINDRLEMPENSVYASLASVATDLGYTSIWGAILAGYPVRLIDQDLMLDADALAEHLTQYPVDLLKVVPSHLHALMASESEGLLPKHTLVLGGEGVNKSLLDKIQKVAPFLRIFNHYGPTETTVGVIAGELSSEKSIALGNPLDGCRVYILDDSLQPVPPGGIGDLYIAGNQLSTGYWQDEKKTSHSFIVDPFYTDEKMYRSGDRVRQLTDGRIQFIGRADGQVKIRGYRVELNEVENYLNTLDGIKEAAVVFNNKSGREVLTAIVVANKALDNIDAEKHLKSELIHLLSSVAPSHMQPHFWHFTTTIPRAINGKVDRKALVTLLTAFDSKVDLFDSYSQSSSQHLFCQLFSEVLGIPLNKITKNDGFFILGGDSILALQLVAMARQQEIALTPQLLFQHQTPAALAAIFNQPPALIEERNLVLNKSEALNKATLLLKKLWQSTLSCSAIKNDDNFFNLGGDSILALQFIASARKEGLKLLPQDVFKYQVLSELALFSSSQFEAEIAIETVLKGNKRTNYGRYNLSILPTSLTSNEVTANITKEDVDEILKYIPANEIEDILPLSPTQEGILFHCLLDNNPQLYLNVTSMALTGKIDCDAFLGAWETAVQRHDINRSHFVWHELEQPYQVVCRQVKMVATLKDWSHLSPITQLHDFDALLEKEQNSGFNLSVSPLMRVSLIKLSDTSYRLLWSRHHLVVDGWTSALIAADAMAIYQSESLQSAPHYADYFHWLNQQDINGANNQWKNYLQNTTDIKHLPMPKAPIQGHGKSHQSLSKEVTRNLSIQASLNGLTLNTLVQLAWSITLSRYLGQYNIVFGMTSSGRPQDVDNIEKMAGVFITTVPVIVELNPTDRIIDIAKQLQFNVVQLRDIDHLPLSKIQSHVNLEPGELLFDTALVFQNYPFPPVLREMTNPQFELLDIFGISNFPMMLQVTPGDALTIDCTFDTQRLSTVLVEDMLSTFDCTLTSLSKDISVTVYSIVDSLAPKALPINTIEKDNDWDFLEKIEQKTTENKHALALVTQRRSLTYESLMLEVDEFSAALIQCIPNDGRPIAVCLNREAELVVVLLSIYKLGLSYIPLDPAQPIQRLTNILEQAEPQLIISDKHSLSINNFASLSVIDVINTKLSFVEATSPKEKQQLFHSNDLAYTIFTSGSTGSPKGVQIERGALNHFLQAISPVAKISQGDVLLALTTVGFDIAVLELFLPLIHGACIILAGDEESKDTLAIINLVKKHHVNVIQATPVTWQGLADEDGEWWSSIHVLVGGEGVPASLANRMIAKASKVTNVYGPTEATVWASSKEVNYTDGQVVGLGEPLINTQFYILDEMLQPVKQGVEGELYIAGSGLARGYLNRPDLTAECFIPNPFSSEPGSRMYRSGDRVVLDEHSQIQFLGRTDFQVKLRGFRIELGEIESVIQSLEGVKGAVAKVWQADSDNGYIAVYATAREGIKLDPTHILQLASKHLSNYMLPHILVVMDALPLNSNGKVNRQLLLPPELKEVFDYVAPTTQIEKDLVDIWLCLLNLEKVGVKDNFFSLGGNSLSATRLQARIQRKFQIQISLAELFHRPTIADLAYLIEDESSKQNDLAEMSNLLALFE